MVEPVILELFSGKGEISKIGGNILDCEYITVDIEHKRSPCYTCDIGKWSKHDTRNIREVVGDRPLIIWASPPCEEYSVMKSCGERDLKKADHLVRKVYKIAKALKPYAIIVENPSTGLLHERKVMKRFEKRVLKHRYIVSYCQYGHPVRKNTHIWCSMDLTKYRFQPLECPVKHCKSSYKDNVTGRWKHVLHFDDFKNYDYRISVPPQLIADIFKAIQRSLRS